MNQRAGSLERMKVFLIAIFTGTLGMALFAQTTSNLADPALQAHATIPQFNPPGTPIRQRLADAHLEAPLKGVTWNGLEFIITDDEALSPSTPVTTLLLQAYQRQACQADAVAVGNVTSSAYHLSAAGSYIWRLHFRSRQCAQG